MNRRSQVRSTRGHVRIEQGPNWSRWVMWGVVALVGLVSVIVVLRQFVLPALTDETNTSNNRTWLEFAWTSTPIDQDAVNQLGQRLEANRINQVYLEAFAWRNDGTLVEGQQTAAFVEALHNAYPEIEILLWLRMSGVEIAQPERRSTVIELAGKAVREWQLDGVQLNGRAVVDGSESFVQLLRDLRGTIGSDALLSVTVPPDRIPFDPDVPIGTTADPELTWDVNYKQRVGLLLIDEIVVMAHAGGLTNSDDYERWVAYQVESYASALAELDRPAEIVIALPTYDAAPDHDPAVEEIRVAIRGVKDGINRAGNDGDLVQGVGLYEYKTTDSLEWTYYRQDWLGLDSE